MSTQQRNQLEHFTSIMRGLGTRTILHEQNVAASLGLYNNDFISLDILREAGPITAGELAKKTGLTTGSITALVDRLEKFGYVYRENDPTDRRRVIIVPDYESKEEVSNSYRPLHKAMLELASSYTEDELTLITQFIGEASTILEEQIQHLSSTRRNKSSS
ncbi:MULTISPECIES: MarR family winged helix-turn-helix transcriptional regulator [unclassified Sporosarcina]|uniref:MarR family winged helix-turn-helix transcriptional regulator n=1 Tax=unclassified Sporosarcina TaxID=2647733 RepID=UPI00203B2B40|nr:MULTISPECIES: MarR family transcriptional regulator [unclassified Sporosarcina]GKV66494.1 putative HTH-type transcriptional regulator YcgE [Sporosarcina sp. NCCP-2331]GLB56771.1 putative HTH-type transcriptional regulator YcgE [Sporosarcina sp. NCCP-2378]